MVLNLAEQWANHDWMHPTDVEIGPAVYGVYLSLTLICRVHTDALSLVTYLRHASVTPVGATLGEDYRHSPHNKIHQVQ